MAACLKIQITYPEDNSFIYGVRGWELD